MYCTRVLWLKEHAPSTFNVYMDFTKDNARYGMGWMSFNYTSHMLQCEYDNATKQLSNGNANLAMPLYRLVLMNKLYKYLRQQNLIEKFAFDRI